MGPSSTKNGRPKRPSGLRRGLTIGLIAFGVAIVMTGPVSLVLLDIDVLDGLLMLVLVTGIAIVADIIAIAATSGSAMPFNAMAAKKIPGAREGMELIRKASLVNSICADVIGDITGTLNGIIATSVIIGINRHFPGLPATVVTTLFVGLIAFATVGGKAAEKNFAVQASTKVILIVGKAIYYVKQAILIVRRAMGLSTSSS